MLSKQKKKKNRPAVGICTATVPCEYSLTSLLVETKGWYVRNKHKTARRSFEVKNELSRND